MCSITKQFTCALLLDACPDPDALHGAIRARLPALEDPMPQVLHLAHNQSGLRDYWAVAMLHGSPVEAPFGDPDAARVIGGTRTLQFAPGTRYAYCNQNFRLLSDALEEHTGRSFAELLRTRIFGPAGMETAFVAADTRAMPDGTEGYEGSPAAGFRAAENRIVWTGDAGLGASLDDMIAWERHVDATLGDPRSLYARLSAPVTFAGGVPAAYGFGLGRSTEFGHAVTGHGGALRGWRSHRLHLASERISIVVLFNHLSDAHAAALDLLAAILDASRPRPGGTLPPPAWLGTCLEPETQLAARIEAAGPGRIRLRYAHVAELLDLRQDGTASNGRTTLQPGAGGVGMKRPQENWTTRLAAAPGDPTADIAGRYRCAELDAELAIVDAGGVLHGGFSGFLGQGRMERRDAIGPDLWALPCPRALDHPPPPGDWTLAIRRGEHGRAVSRSAAGSHAGCPMTASGDAPARAGAIVPHGTTGPLGATRCCGAPDLARSAMRRASGRADMSTTGLDVRDNTIQTAHVLARRDHGGDRRGPARRLACARRGAARTARPAADGGGRASRRAAAAVDPRDLLRAMAAAAPGVPVRSLEDFLDRVAMHLDRGRTIGADAATAAMFRALAHHVDEGLVEKLRNTLPGSIRNALRAAAA
jgi:D-aminopeptidase